MYLIHLPNGRFAADDMYEEYSDNTIYLDATTVAEARKFTSYKQAEEYRNDIALWASEWTEDDGTAEQFRDAKIEQW